MKINLKLPGGGILEFEGDADEFALVTEFLGEPPPSLTEPASPAGSSADDSTDLARGLDDAAGGTGMLEGASPLDGRNVLTRLESVGARTDMERVTVLAQLAVEAGEDGIDYPTIDRLFTELGLRKPPRFPKTFSNAKNAGLVRSVAHGRWRPTVRGENYARGHGRTAQPGGQRRSRQPASTNRGDDTD
jgi:hypothetical protein